MEEVLHTFLDGSRMAAEEQIITGELVCHLLFDINFTNTTLKINYRAKVMAQMASMTPLLHHAYKVLNDWNRVKASDPMPWTNIKAHTPYHSLVVVACSTPGPVVTPASVTTAVKPAPTPARMAATPPVIIPPATTAGSPAATLALLCAPLTTGTTASTTAGGHAPVVRATNSPPVMVQ